MKSVDINCDMGEWPELTSREVDRQIMPYISSCNITCGYHSGSNDSIKKTIELALKHKVVIGAHPSYKDKKKFGRKSLNLKPAELKNQIEDQLNNFNRILIELGANLHHIKPHGALYNDMANNIELSLLVLDTIKNLCPTILIYGLANSQVAKACEKLGLKYAHEVFADRQYENATQLRSRKYNDALIPNITELDKHLDMLIMSKVKDVNNHIHLMSVDTICIHSDTHHSVSYAQHIHSHLQSNNIEVSAIW